MGFFKILFSLFCFFFFLYDLLLHLLNFDLGFFFLFMILSIFEARLNSSANC